MIKNNGLLIYIVCSFLNEEGKYIIEQFLEKNKNFSLQKFSAQESINVESCIDKDGYYYVIPKTLNGNIPIDGFFSAMLKKND